VRFVAAVTGLAIAGAAAGAAAEPLQLEVKRIDSFAITHGGEAGGPLEFLGGLELRSNNPKFGGLSGIDVVDGSTAVMVGDQGTLVRGRLVYDGGRLTGLADTEIEDLFPQGDVSKRVGDVEDIAFDLQNRSRGVIVRERQANAMFTFELADGSPADFQLKTVGADDRILKSNNGLESVAYAPAGSPIAGEIVTIAERPRRRAVDLPGWIAGLGPFSVVRHDRFDVSSARFLPDGDLLLLERRYILPFDISVRIRRIDGADVAVGARLDGDYLLDAGVESQIDNMEGLAVHQDEQGRTILTLVSDDNHSILQRTLILQFALQE
jgi:hypothetical protein